ncbi:phage minor capsid protein [Lacrimispora sp. 210928-DFI.3.58]|uniref:phage minor capsid protein n=1 Tax=Lacrimispora sp. 210928-DFI.3.58 TaxID=2883214 RepID=UPI001D09708B|nr:phage minor capsid protein [Lacrimispora sp. 210928-DFI.3.58]MCB7320786.1 phage minor capsid protein [Lacrimispora sp. 210928-DFI.3.58]
MPLDEYDITAAFQAIEDELIASMIRNMKRHRVEETREGIEWSMWQAEQLKAMEKYKRENQKKYGKQFTKINREIDVLIRKARRQGNMQQEIRILQAIKKGYKVHGRNKSQAHKAMTAEFFRLNDRKLEALIEATTHDMETAETAVLRMANDQYRKAIFNAQVYANTGAGTYEKAVDMATKDMLSRGLNCIVYANGARHTLSDYADMAIRTASKRAYLAGEGEKRQEWGISTVIVNKRGNPCPKCLPFCGKVLIDDVWSNGKKGDGPYPLMSTAVAAGLYHPRCKDSHTTYFPGISTADDTWTEEELEAVGKANKKEARQQYAERQAEKYGRLAEYSLDQENKKLYEQRFKAWDAKAGQHFAATDDIKAHRKDTPPRMAEMVDQYTADEFTIIDENAPDAFAYHPDLDAVVVNPNHVQYEHYDPAAIMIHEIAHRIDFNELGSPMNSEFSTALVELSDRLLLEKEYYQSLFAPGGKLEYNELISDIIASVTHNEIRGAAYHDLDYIQQLGNKEMEVFADTFAVFYNGGDESVEFIQKELPELHQAFIKLLGE